MEKITIQNFRKIKETWELNLAPITFLTGTNNSGKSSVMKALMLLDGFGSSKNHFELNFNQKHSRNHKIDCFSNAVNRQNFREKLWDINFSIENKDYFIDYHFYPLDNNDNRSEKGKLKSLKFKSKYDNSLFSITNLADDEYKLTIDNSFINFRNNDPDIFDEQENKNELDSFKIVIENDLKESESILKKIDKTSIERVQFLDKVKSLKAKLKEVNKKIKDLENNKIEDDLQFNPTFKLRDFGGSESIDKIIREVLSKYFRDNEKEIGLSNTNRDLFRLSSLGDIVVDALNLNVSHLTPNRNTQTRLYVNDNGNNDIYDIIKSLSENPIKKKSKADIFIKKWMSKDFFDIGEDYNIRPIEGLASKIEIQENGDVINLVDKGFGAGQIFTILLRIADVINEENQLKDQKRDSSFISSSPCILIEEPEANLHPAFQSLLAELFLETWKEFGIQFIVETHSEYIIRKSQVLFVEYTKSDISQVPAMRIQYNPFSVIYFDKDGPYEMKYRKDGRFTTEFGTGFFDVNSNLIFDLP
ncbi:ATP-binding protein [Flavobacterium sp. K77]|uniref:AAA family ATPase n=1 Tax=Flavobacterium sp. K77 TaxID=2910676 RepID=UPI001F26D4C2|nr:AAA family ATPase [Flavobacterium sp. K77]MCF6140507.1 ATP-binding protein [Flavobacterium sp. K77]